MENLGNGLVPESENSENRPDVSGAYLHSRDLAYQEQGAKRDTRITRLMNQETIGDVACMLEYTKESTDWSLLPLQNEWGYREAGRRALEASRAFSKTPEDLVDEKIISGEIGEDGYLVEGGKVLHGGYAIRIDRVEKEILLKQRRPVFDDEGRFLRDKVEGRYVTQVVERPYFGTEKERAALALANESLYRHMILEQKLHEQTYYFDLNKPALENMVNQFYKRQIGFTNEQIGWFFTAPDINEIKFEKTEAENRENKALGDRRDKAMRLLYLVGICETREKLEEHLNNTFNFEEIFDTETVDSVIKRIISKDEEVRRYDSREIGADERRRGLNEMAEMLERIKQSGDPDEKFKLVVKYMLGAGVEAKKVEGVWKYKANGWLTADERDPSKARTKREGQERGIGAPKKLEGNVRGFLTKFGNPYTRNSVDTLLITLKRISEVVGDESAVKDADRFFWTRGMRDELGLEIYARDSLPTGDFLVDIKNRVGDNVEDWEKKVTDVYLPYFSLPGEPVGSDLSKIFYPHFYRLKDILRDRKSGPIQSVDKFERFTQGMLNVCYTSVEVKKRNNEIEEQNRSVVEQWLGYKGDDIFTPEKAKDLGDISWQQITVPGEIEDALSNVEPSREKIPVDSELSLDTTGVGDNADGFYWLMNYLAGDEDPSKRPWAFINLRKYDPNEFTDTDAFTGRNKFLQIIFNTRTLPWGDFRKWYRLQDQERKRTGDRDITANDLLNDYARRLVDYSRKAWYGGIRTLPQFPRWCAEGNTIKYKYIGTNNADALTWVQVVEGRGLGNPPGLAVKYGFLKKEDSLSKVTHAERIFG